jgi:hypothetical protein
MAGCIFQQRRVGDTVSTILAHQTMHRQTPERHAIYVWQQSDESKVSLMKWSLVMEREELRRNGGVGKNGGKDWNEGMYVNDPFWLCGRRHCYELRQMAKCKLFGELNFIQDWNSVG